MGCVGRCPEQQTTFASLDEADGELGERERERERGKGGRGDRGRGGGRESERWQFAMHTLLPMAAYLQKVGLHRYAQA